MKKLEGFEVIKKTANKIVQEQTSDGIKTIVVGNPNPDPKEHQIGVNYIGNLLTKCSPI